MSDEDREQDDLRKRFPDPDADPRLQVPRGSELPEVPSVTFQRPASPEEKSAKGSSWGGTDLRGMGAASTIGITLVASIGIGTGLGWLVDKYLLKGSGTPWGLIIGFLMGVASGFINLIRVTNQLNRFDK